MDLQQTMDDQEAVSRGALRNPADGLSQRYLLAFAGVAALLLLNQLLVQPALIRVTSDAPVINMAGRQRMLCQKLAKEALVISSLADARDIAECGARHRNTVAAWERAHIGLQAGDATLELPANNSEKISEAFRELQPVFESIRSASRRIDATLRNESLPSGTQSEAEPKLAEVRSQTAIILANEPEFLEHMEAIVGLFEEEARARVRHLRASGWIITGAILGVMAVVWSVVLRPARQLIQQQFRTISKSEQRYRLLVQKMSDGLAIQDRDGVLYYVNDRLCEMVGYSRGELLGRRISEFVDRGSQTVFCEQLSGDQFRGRALPDVTWTTQRGEKLFTLVSIAPVPDPDGSSPHLYSVITDITERKRAEDALRRAHNELEGRITERTQELVLANRSLEREMSERQHAEERTRRLSNQLAQSMRLNTIGEMAAGLAHEINQPLGAITNFAEGCLAILDRDPQAAPGLQTALERISAAALRAGETLKRIRTFVQRGERQYVPVDLVEVVGEVAGLCRFEAEAEGVALALKSSGPYPSVLGDPIQLQQVLVNLIRNAIQALKHPRTPERGRQVVIQTIDYAGADVEVSVADNGEGISAERLAMVFDPFHTTRADGLGLGLAISRSIIEQHGGRLWVESPPGEGAIFRFTLPSGAPHVC